MLFKHAARGDERVYGTYKNVEASSITNGYLAALRLGTSASFDGTQVVRAAGGNTADLPGFIGVAAQDIVSNGYGLIQLYGSCASVFLSGTTTSLTINVGDPLVPGALAGGAFSLAPTYVASGFAYVIASNVSNASITGWISGFMRHGL